jgi:hypothetical protein
VLVAGQSIQNHAAFIWSVADLLRGDDKQSEDGEVILPLTLLRHLDWVLEPTKQAVLDGHAQLGGRGAVDGGARHPLDRVAGTAQRCERYPRGV